jgi:hypothetical protein
MRFKHGYARVAGTSRQQDIKTQVNFRLFRAFSFFVSGRTLTLLATSQEAGGRADYQQTDSTSISTNVCTNGGGINETGAVTQKVDAGLRRGQLH